MKKHVCDRCGIIIDTPWWYEGKIRRTETDRRVISEYPDELEFDICLNCIGNVFLFVGENSDDTSIKKEKERRDRLQHQFGRNNE